MNNGKWEELDPFETVVGGLSWCMGYIHPEYTQEIIYTKEMPLGKKLAVSEKITFFLKEYEIIKQYESYGVE